MKYSSSLEKKIKKTEINKHTHTHTHTHWPDSLEGHTYSFCIPKRKVWSLRLGMGDTNTKVFDTPILDLRPSSIE